MIKLREARITDGVPKIVAAQPWVQVLSEVYAELQGRVLDCLDAGVTFSEVDSCSEATLDQMAVYLKVEWYDSAADLETKRRIIKTAIEIQRYAGTVKAVREQVSVTYPDSEVEEWFDYGGTPGFWRLNVNITDAPAQYHTIDEMEDLLGYTKRLTAHLEHISYMVRHGISIGAQVECMAYKVPICGATICGTYWRPSTLGWSSNGLLNVGGQAEAFLDSPKITGTIPRISTKGWSGGQALDATPQMDAYKIHPAESGDGTATGEKPRAATLGASSAATVSNAVKVEAFKVKPRVCGRAKCNK